MRCGLKHDHPDLTSVRQCYANRYGWPDTDNSAATWDASVDYRQFDAEIQRRERAEDEAVARYKANRDAGMDAAMLARREAAATRAGASRGDLRQLRTASRNLSRPGNCDLNPGGYAVPSRTGSNDLDFWWIDRPEQGKWAGWTFVERVIGGRPNQRVSRAESAAALATLAALSPVDREESQATFGTELGECYACHRTLTDDLSRSLGIGPVCRSRS
jgi:uncharacterized protein DUF6011